MNKRAGFATPMKESTGGGPIYQDELCPDCFMGRVDQNGNKPSGLDGYTFHDCPRCNGTGELRKGEK